MIKLPQPTIERLCTIYQLLCELEKSGTSKVSSTELGKLAGVLPHTVRKDINYFGEIGNTGSGYDLRRLKEHLARNLGIESGRKACVVGLGRLGSAIIQTPSLADGEFEIVAGFDSNINKVETIQTQIALFPSYEIADVVQRMGIDLGIIAVTPKSAQEVADRLVEGGVRGIINFAPVIIRPKNPEVTVRQVDITNELRILSAIMATNVGIHDVTIK